MRIFFDTEFTGLSKDAQLISIGLISETGESFYAEFEDYDINLCSEWVRDNVIANLSKSVNELIVADTNVKGDTLEIRDELLKWLNQFDTVEWVSDVSHYDFVLLIDLLYKNALNIHSNYCAACHDINQDIAKHYNISEIEAFNMSREDILLELKGNEIDGAKHNSFYDAQVIKYIYENLN